MVHGMQQDGDYLKVAACAKHFAVHSGPEAVRHTFDAEVSAKDLEETYLPAFQALVEDAEVESVMGAYNRVNGDPACASPMLMQKLKDWQFDGLFRIAGRFGISTPRIKLQKRQPIPLHWH